MPHALLKKIARMALGEYQIFRIYAFDRSQALQSPHAKQQDWMLKEVNLAQVSASADEAIRQRAWYLGEDANAFGCFHQDRMVALCVFWHGNRYRTQRNFWPLAENEAKLVEIITLPEARGQGIAGLLIRHACNEMFAKGFRRLFARIWHNNLPSIRAFEKSGWQYLTTVVEIRPLLLGRRPVRFKFKRP